ncbi:hypothetical protein ALI144C_37305 [Actinosynnema sp. ALI-1.44]|uniref:hypothetical protein n=1 Tax=Actinosynnema sp. ALI-1.44 TaxID=1933779 RepID=UPI00097C4D11|nr:hypothetical protein [Actinosynnema sp. ALI-1.44]ONI76317.1 hypothetical protein ALI144C_37305 [Actinosynnema sp. ALI-1.44]
MDIPRRRFIQATGVGSAVIGAGLVATAPAGAEHVILTPDQRRMVLRVAETGTAVPSALPDLDEPGSAISRATGDRLDAHLARLAPDRVALVRDGAQGLIAGGLLAADDKKIATVIGQQVAGGTPPAPLVAVVSAAVGTVSKRLAPTADDAARLWLSALWARYQAGGQK